MAQKAFLSQLKTLQENVDKVQPSILTEVAHYLVAPEVSPDDTGAYILSHSIGRSGNVGRRISSSGRQSARDTHRGEALDHLLSQVASIPPNSTRVWVGNNSPHVNAVEYGDVWPNGNGYYVFTTLRSIFPSLVAEAVQKAGLK
jgi:hypothetical protein